MLIVLLATIVAVFSQLEAAEINCTRIEHKTRYKIYCRLDNNTVINEDNVTFAGLENSEVNRIVFDKNQDIKLLPVKVYEKFPNVIEYWAQWIGLKKISALNFEKLWNLKILQLGFNKIEFIPDDCFANLNKLFKIALRNSC